MKHGNKFGAWFCGLVMAFTLTSVCVAAQRPSKDNPRPAPRNEQRQAAPQRNNRPPDAYRAPRQQPRQDRRAQEPSRNYNQQGRPQARRDDRLQNRPQNRPESNQERQSNRADTSRPNYNANRPPERRFQERSPQEQRDLARKEEQLKRLPPQQRQELSRREETWKQLTPAQQSHIKNDIFPKWQQMSPQRQKAIQNRLAVLQNMPETARNRHLSDPNFTRGMSDEDRQMLRDLSHQHVRSPA